MATPVPTPGEPDFYESLADALLTASAAFLEAEPHFRVGMAHLRNCVELDRQVDLIDQQVRRVSTEAQQLASESIELTQADLPGNLARVRELMAEFREKHDQISALLAGAAALTREATAETTKGLEIWGVGSAALRVGLERAATLLQQARRRQTNGGTPDALAA